MLSCRSIAQPRKIAGAPFRRPARPKRCRGLATDGVRLICATHFTAPFQGLIEGRPAYLGEATITVSRCNFLPFLNLYPSVESDQ